MHTCSSIRVKLERIGYIHQSNMVLSVWVLIAQVGKIAGYVGENMLYAFCSMVGMFVTLAVCCEQAKATT